MRQQRGFTLVELLFALLILSIVILTTMAMFTERQRRLRLANETILAWQALANETEVRRRVDYEKLDDAPATFITETELLRPMRPFTTSVTVESMAPHSKRVTMSIVWRNGAQRAALSIVRSDTGGSNLW